MLESLPQSLAHGDACPQNLLADPREPRGLVAIDWGFVGMEPVGYDLGQLLVGRFESGEMAVSDLAPLSDLILDSYVAGLGDEGWTGDRQRRPPRISSEACCSARRSARSRSTASAGLSTTRRPTCSQAGRDTRGSFSTWERSRANAAAE